MLASIKQSVSPPVDEAMVDAPGLRLGSRPGWGVDGGEMEVGEGAASGLVSPSTSGESGVEGEGYEAFVEQEEEEEDEELESRLRMGSGVYAEWGPGR